MNQVELGQMEALLVISNQTQSIGPAKNVVCVSCTRKLYIL